MMREKDPIPLLQNKLDEYKRDLYKSFQLYHDNQITAEIHVMHRENLGALIQKFTEAIKLLT